MTIQYLGPLDPGGTNVAAAKECSEQSGGRYTVAMSPVANSADATRELFVRRLAAGDENMDIINMDTIYTPEFAEAGWLTEMTGADKEDALNDVLEGPAESVLDEVLVLARALHVFGGSHRSWSFQGWADSGVSGRR